MKKLLSLTLVLTMLFTIISISSVSAVGVGESLESGYVTVFKGDLENTTLPFATAGQSFNCFLQGFTPSVGNSNVNNLELSVSYSEEGITPPSDTGEDFGSRLMRVRPKVDTVTSYTNFRMRCPLPLANSYTPQQGKEYRASVWVYVADKIGGDETNFNMYLTVADGAVGGNPGYTSVPMGQWTKLSFKLTPSSTYTKGLVYTIEGGLSDSKNTYAKTVYLDNFRLEEVNKEEVVVTTEVDGQGTVYGAGTYEKGKNVTLNAGAGIGQKFEGYYIAGECVSTNPSYTFKADNVTVVAKFVSRDAYVKPATVLYSFGNEPGDVGVSYTWVNVGSQITSDKSSVYDKPITYEEAAEYGVFVPDDNAGFGDYLYTQNTTGSTPTGAMAGRFRGWENGSTGAGKYVAGKKYKLTWWVYPKSVYLANGETSQPTTRAFTLKMQYDGSNTAGIADKSFTVNVGQWNELVWEFTATDAMETIAPGFRYDWGQSKNTSTNASTTVEHVFYDNLVVEQIHEDDFELTIADKGTTVEAVGTVVDTKDAMPVNAIVIIAAYDSQGKLVGVSTSTPDGVSTAIGGKATATYTKDSSAKYIAFFWNNLTDIRPYVASVELN